jgi:tetratricopeptide (TPR) repeat protein
MSLYGAYGQTPDIMTRPFYNPTGYISGNLLGHNTSHYQAATQLDAYRFPGINQNIRLKDYFSNYSWFNHYEYPSFNNPVKGETNFPANSYWLLIGLLLPQRSPVDPLSQGYAYFQKEQYESAIEELNKAIRLPYEKVAKVQGYLLLGMSYQSLGTEYLEDAEKYLELAAGLEVYNTEVILQLAKVYYQQGKYSKAIEEYRRVIEKEPENGEAVRGLALSYFKANELTKALKELHKVEIKDPNDLEIMYTTGIIFEEKHLFAEAIQYLNKVIDLAPDSSWASQARDHLQDIERSGDATSIDDIKEEEIKMLIMTAPEPEEMPDDDLIILLDDIHYEILPDNTLIHRIHKLVKILNERGKGVGEVKLSYDSTYQHITIELARVIKPDGTIIGVGADNIQEVAPWVDFPFYGNTKVLIISMPGLTVGSVIEYQATIEDIPLLSKIFRAQHDLTTGKSTQAFRSHP